MNPPELFELLLLFSDEFRDESPRNADDDTEEEGETDDASNTYSSARCRHGSPGAFLRVDDGPPRDAVSSSLPNAFLWSQLLGASSHPPVRVPTSWSR